MLNLKSYLTCLQNRINSMKIYKKILIGLIYLPISTILSASYISAGELNSEELVKLKALYERPKYIPFPKENPFSLEKVELGKTLFFDPRMSDSGTQSCATCHNPSFSWGDGMGLGTGNGHNKLGRKSPSILNLAWDHDSEAYMWDGRKESLEDQALGPIQADVEMNMNIDRLVAFLKTTKDYKPLFEDAFPDDANPIKASSIAKSIATYERTIVSNIAPFDKWIMGDELAISSSAKKGFELYNGKANCAACHSGWRFSDASFHDIGLKSEDIGRGAFVPVASMKFAFKTVGLRNIDLRAPYMHDGSIETLAEVIDHYDSGFIQRESLSSEIKKLNLTQNEKRDLLSFLKTITSKDTPVRLPVLPK